MTNQVAIVQIRGWLQEARRVAVLTGAGISAESGIPTFRGTGGLWRNCPAEQLATPEAFARDPALVWEWYDWRRAVVAEKSPNPGHFALAEMERQHPSVTLITQNVDGLHDLAGSASPLKLHGDIWQVRCTQCDYRATNREVPLTPIPPRCSCGAVLRPDIVWFGEALPEGVLRNAWAAAQIADLFLVVGTSALVQPAASLPRLALERHARVVEINLEHTPLSRHCDISLRGASGEILPLLLGD